MADQDKDKSGFQGGSEGEASTRKESIFFQFLHKLCESWKNSRSQEQMDTQSSDGEPKANVPDEQITGQRVATSPRSSAYLARKKGRKTLSDSRQDADALLKCIQRRGEAVPGDMAQELGMARSTLAYHLNRLVKHGYIQRVGGGRSIRYRVAPEALEEMGKL